MPEGFTVMAYTPANPCLRTTVRITPAAANALSSTVLDIPLAVWMNDTPLGFQWHVAIQIGGQWNQISVASGTPGITLGNMYDDGSIPIIIQEINVIGMAAWVMRELKDWLNALLRAYFAEKVGAPVGEIDLNPATFGAAINAYLATLSITTGADGVPRL